MLSLNYAFPDIKSINYYELLITEPQVQRLKQSHYMTSNFRVMEKFWDHLQECMKNRHHNKEDVILKPNDVME